MSTEHPSVARPGLQLDVQAGPDQPGGQGALLLYQGLPALRQGHSWGEEGGGEFRFQH